MLTLRLFIAADLPDQVRQALGRFRQEGRKASRGDFVRWLEPEGIHLTLKFLGDVGAEAVPELNAALERACQGVGPIALSAAGVGCFPSAQRPRVVWVGVRGELDKLRALQQRVERETASWAAPEDREFHPHLTIGRIRHSNRRDAQELGALVQSHAERAFGDWRVERVELMQSHLGPQGAKYERLSEVSLA